MIPTHRIRLFVRICQCCLAALAFVACRGGSDDAVGEWDEEQGTHFQLVIHTNGTKYTRATGPNGGNDGDGQEAATGNEAKAYNATVLLYRSNKGINATDAEAQLIKIEHAFYTPTLNWDNTKQAYCSPLLHDEVYITPGTYHVIILVNMGDMTSLKGKTLSEVRDMKYDSYPWRGTDIATYDRFVMTSAEDLAITFGTTQTGPDHPVTFTANVSRLAARIDFSPGTGRYSDTPLDFTPEGGTTPVTLGKYYEYDVTDMEGNPNGDKYYLAGWCPINLRKDNCYLLRRVSDRYDGTALEYLGRERAVNTGTTENPKWVQQNYVIDPLTPTKTEDATGFDFTNVFDNYYNNDTPTTFPNDSKFLIKSGTAQLPIEEDGMHYHTLAYTMENTLRTDSPKETYATGIALKGYYAKYDSDTGNYSYTVKNYIYYIRHSDPNNSNNDAMVMKYGIVRNNIYRVFINSFSTNGQLIIETVNWLNVVADDIYL